MNNVIRFVSKSDLERERLIREARAIYESIFPPAMAAGEPSDGHPEQTGVSKALLSKPVA